MSGDSEMGAVALADMRGEAVVDYMLDMVDSARDAHPGAGLDTLRRLLERHSEVLVAAHEVLSDSAAEGGAA